MATRERWGEVSTRQARTEKRCDWCYEAIAPGTKYRRYFGPEEGGQRAVSTVAHAECEDASLREGQDFGDASWGDRHKRGMTLAEMESSQE